MLLLAVALSALDLIALVGRLVAYIKSVRAGQDQFTVKGCWRAVVLDRADDLPTGTGPEYTGLVSDEPDELDAAELKAREIEDDDEVEPINVRRAQIVAPIQTDLSPRVSSEEDHDHWANDIHGHSRYPQSAASERTVFDHSPRGSVHSDETLHETVAASSWFKMGRADVLKKIGGASFATAERVLVFAGLFQTLTGIVIYTGGCRENYINGCLAHLISASFRSIYT